MSRKKIAREVRERLASATFDELTELERAYRRQIPAAQSVHAAVRRELRSRRCTGEHRDRR